MIESEVTEPKDIDGAALAKKWLREIYAAKEGKDYKRFISDGRRIESIYGNTSLTVSTTYELKDRVYYNLLYSTIQTLLPTYFARVPKPVTDRPIKNDDPVAELAALIEERAVVMSMSLERDSLFRNCKQSVLDFMLVGRGQLWQSFYADSDENGNLINERCETEYVHWEDYLEGYGRVPSEIKWKARRYFLTRDELIKQFGEIGREVPLNREENSTKEYRQTDYIPIKQAEVWMICDLMNKWVLWVADGFSDNCLKYELDPWRLNHFFPCPTPILYSRTNSSNIPTPFYLLVRQILDDLDFTHKRIVALSECLRYVGMHDALWNKEIIDIRNMTDGMSSPSNQWAMFAERGGFKGVQDWLPLGELIQAIRELKEHMAYQLERFYEVSGVAEVIRGYSSPTKTATAVQMEGQFTVLRTQEKQAEVQTFLRELLDIKAQMIFELFSDQTIMQMVGYDQMSPEEQRLFPVALQLLRDDKLRTFRIEIETDSTIAIDEEADKQGRMEFIGALGQLLNNAYQMASIDPNTKKLMFDVIKFGVKGFRAGRELEGDIQGYIKQIEYQDALAAQQQAAMANQPAPPSPEEIEMMMAQQKAQSEMQIAQMKAESDAQAKQHKAYIDEMLANHKTTLENMKAMQEIELKRYKLDADTQLSAEKIRADMAVKAMEAADRERFATVEHMKANVDKTPNVTVVMPHGKKVARAIKAPDGSFLMQSEDVN